MRRPMRCNFMSDPFGTLLSDERMAKIPAYSLILLEDFEMVILCRAPRLSLVLIGVAIMLASGCEQVGSVVDDVKSSVSGDATETESDVAAAAPVETRPVQTAPATPPPNPQELIAEFKGLKPHEIGDSALMKVTSSPEAAAAITEVVIKAYDGISGAGIEAMKAMPNLESLQFPGAGLSAGELGTIGQLTSLKRLTLSGSLLDDSVVSTLSSLGNLEALDISGTRISPAAGQSLAKFTQLQSVHLQSTQVNDATIAALASLPIRELNLSKTRITNNALATIGKMSNLESLDVSFTQVNGAGFKGINRTGMKKLNVGETNFGIEGFIVLKTLQFLCSTSPDL